MLNREDFKYINLTNKIRLITNSILIISLFIGLNIIASNYYLRKDLTENRFYSLSPETLAYLNKLNQPIEIIVTIPSISSQPETAQIYLILSRLMNEYVYATRNNLNGKITVEYIDPFKQMQKAHEISAQFGVQKSNAIILKSGENYRQIAAHELFVTKMGTIVEFKGEQVFTSAILNVSGSQKEKIYFITGHGEMQLNDTDPLRGLSEVYHLLKTYNIDIDQLELSQITEIPSNSNLIIIASPQTPFLPEEVEQLRRYLIDRNGRLIAFLNPFNQHGLEALFYEWGILADNMLILDVNSDFKANSGDHILRNFTKHPITHFLEDNQLSIMAGFTRPIRPDITSPIDPRRTVTPLILSSATSWAKRTPEKMIDTQFDPNKDLQGPIPIAALAERRVNSQLGINIRGGRLVVFGNSNLIANNRINALGNRMIFQNTINWAIDLNDLLNIPPKTLKKYQITFSQKDLLHIGLSMLAVPGSIACLGLIILTIRRQ